MRTAAAGGVPVPDVIEVHSDALVLERIDGPTMLEEIQRQPWRFMSFGRELGRIHRRVADSGLAHGDFRRSSSNDDYTSICRAIPPVHQIARTAPQCPDREIQAERRNWPQLELERGWLVTRHGSSPRRPPPPVRRGRSTRLRGPARLRLHILLQRDRIVVLRIVRAVHERDGAAASG